MIPWVTHEHRERNSTRVELAVAQKHKMFKQKVFKNIYFIFSQFWKWHLNKFQEDPYLFLRPLKNLPISCQALVTDKNKIIKL